MSTEIITIIIGILGAIIGVYYKENFNLAKAQKKIATKLSSYLNYENDTILFTDEVKSLYDFSNLSMSDEKIYSIEYLNSIGNESKNKKIFMEKLLKEKGEESQKVLLDKYLRTKSETDILFIDFLDALKKEAEDIKNGITMISDDEASLLPLEMCQYFIYYKKHMLSAIDSMIKYHKSLRHSKEFDYDQNKKLFIATLVSAFNYLMVLKPLNEMAKKYSRKNTSVLAIKNIFS